MKLLLIPSRTNMIYRDEEIWRPPVFEQAVSFGGRIRSILRRVFDLQAASVWNDLRVLLPACRGALLDVGCGAQPYRRLLNDDCQYHGIDTTDAFAHYGYSVPDTTYFAGDIWPVASGSQQVVLATEVLEHIKNPSLFLSEAARVLGPNGTLILTIPFAARWHYIPYDYWRFTPSGLQEVLNESGFNDIKVYARGNELTVASYKVMSLIFMLLLSPYRGRIKRLGARFVGCLCVPLLLVISMVGQLSLKTKGGNDCLGYTALAMKSRSSEVVV